MGTPWFGPNFDLAVGLQIRWNKRAVRGSDYEASRAIDTDIGRN